MRALLKAMALCGLVAAGSSVAMAQTRPADGVAQSGIYGFMQVWSVTGHPISGVVETVRTETLADGTHIQTKGKTVIYRDSEGRMRAENYIPVPVNKEISETPMMIEIYDPVAGFIYSLQPRAREGQRIPTHNHTGKPAQAQGSSGQSAVVQATRTPRPKPDVEQLGTQDFDGVEATGVRTTVIIPEGAQGNDRALTTVIERWQSQELGVIPLEKISDQRNGESERRITSLEQSEPDATLFEVPADYTIKDQ